MAKCKKILESLVKKQEDLETEVRILKRHVTTLESNTDVNAIVNSNLDLKSAIPDDVLSTSVSMKKDINPYTAIEETTIPYGSRVVLKSGIMQSQRAFIMNVTQTDGRNLYHAQTSGQTDMFVRKDEILEVEKKGTRTCFNSDMIRHVRWQFSRSMWIVRNPM